MMKLIIMKITSKGGLEKMRKVLFLMLFAFLAVVLTYGMANAIATGVCSGCHTMHASQNGTTMGDGPNPNLTLSTCITCHTSASVVPAAPKIADAYPGSSSAGGSFDTGTTTDANVHNVSELNTLLDAVGADGDLSNTPPGGTVLTSQLKCAGANGCHGDHTGATSDAGIKGFHHGTHALSSTYRFLVYTTDIASGTGQNTIGGTGSTDWEEGGADATNHNLYKSGVGTDTISKFCAVCHGLFHGNANTFNGSDWIRHPTEEEVSDLGSVASITVDYDENPFAFTSFSGMSTTTATNYNATNGQVMCLSCHRAHGSDQADLLRFNYANQIAGTTGTTTGCLACHVGQRG